MFRKLGLCTLLFGGTLLLAGCSTSSAPDLADDEVFEEKHADEMDKKINNGVELVETASPTIDLLMPEVEVPVVEEEVEYADGVKGFYVYPEGNPQAPGVVVIHEWWGLNEHIKDMARVLAMNGYAALAVDLYDGEVATDMERARELTGGLDDEVATVKLLAAEEYLRKESSKVASIGRCMGGAQSLNLSLASESLDATVIYYGRLQNDAVKLASINQPLLGIFAEDDGGIPPSAVQAFQDGLDEAGKDDYDITIYPGVGHAFANPTGGNYEQEATIDAWGKTLSFLEEELKE